MSNIKETQREKELAELVDACYIIVELYKSEGEYNQQWKKDWLEKARRLVPGCDSMWY